MNIQIIGRLRDVRTIARKRTMQEIRDVERLRRRHGVRRWAHKKGIGLLRLPDGSVQLGAIGWYEAHGVGRVEIKLRFH